MKIELLGRHTIVVTFTPYNTDETIRKELLIDLLKQNKIDYKEQANTITLSDINHNLELLRCFYAFFMPAANETHLSGYFIFLKHVLENLKIPYNPVAETIAVQCKDKRRETLFSKPHAPVEPHYFLEPCSLAKLEQTLQTDQAKFQQLPIKRRLAICIATDQHYLIILLKLEQNNFSGKITFKINVALIANYEIQQKDIAFIQQTLQTAYKVTLPLNEITLVDVNQYVHDIQTNWTLSANIVYEWLAKDFLFLPITPDQKLDVCAISILEGMYNFSKKPIGNLETKDADMPQTPVVTRRDELTEFDRLLKKDEGCAAKCMPCCIL